MYDLTLGLFYFDIYLQDIPGGLTSFGVEEYYPYVYFKINIDMLEDKK